MADADDPIMIEACPPLAATLATVPDPRARAAIGRPPRLPARYRARSIAAEMHSAASSRLIQRAIRTHLPFSRSL